MTDRHSDSKDEVPVTCGPEYWAHFLDDLDEDDYAGEGPHLITVDELRAAGALDVPPEWRKSLRVERDLFSGLLREEHFNPDQTESTPGDVDNDKSADEPA